MTDHDTDKMLASIASLPKPEKRRCKQCGAIISAYNRRELCAVHQVKRPKKPVCRTFRPNENTEQRWYRTRYEKGICRHCTAKREPGKNLCAVHLQKDRDRKRGAYQAVVA